MENFILFSHNVSSMAPLYTLSFFKVKFRLPKDKCYYYYYIFQVKYNIKIYRYDEHNELNETRTTFLFLKMI